MESLDLLKSIISTLSYLAVASKFFAENKKTNSIIYAVTIFSIDIISTIGGWEVQANFIYLAITSVFIGRYYGGLKGFSFAITIFTAFQWTIVFLGSIVFIFYPYWYVTDTFAYVAALSLAHLGAAFLLSKYSAKIFRLDTSNKLLVIDIGAKLFFIVFFNLFLPSYFEILGMRYYPILSLVLLTIAIIFVIYREYSASLEKQIAIKNRDLLLVSQWAEQINRKYDGYDFHGFDYIKEIDNPIIRASLWELVNTSERFGIKLNLSINLPQHINLNNYDLFSIVSGFIENALSIAKLQTEKLVCVVIEREAQNFIFEVQTKLDNAENGIFTDARIKKDNIISQMKKNKNIRMSYTTNNIFTQSLIVDV